MTKRKQGLPQLRSDYLLVQQYLQGDQHAWDTLYRKAYPSVLRFLCTLYSKDRLSVSDRDDILSEAFSRCQAQASRFQGRSKFST